LRSPIKDLFPEINDWNVGDEFRFRRHTNFYINYEKCYLRSVNSTGDVIVETSNRYFLDFSLVKFLKIAYNKSLKDKEKARDIANNLNIDNILKQK
jgi:hypothetical protein